jgi:HEAT repeat protein
VELLCALVRDTERAQKLSNGSSVNERTRAFAAFGLGLLLQRLPEPAAHDVVITLLDVLTTPATSGRNLKVAAIEALSLLPRAWSTDPGEALRRRVVAALGAYYDLDLGPGEQLMQAHVPPAIGCLLRPTDAAAAVWKQRFAADLEAGLDRSGPSPRNLKVNPHIAQSCALALGALASPWQHEDDADGAIGKLLLDVYRRHRDQQTRSFAILSLARQGGSLARDALLRELDRANQAIERPWCAMALGVWSARALEAAKAAGQVAATDAVVRDALRQHFAAARNPSTIGSLAIALGLAGDVEAADKLRASLLDNRQQEDVASYLAMALGLMRDQRALADIRTLRHDAARRPTLQMQCVRALGLLGDHTLVDELCRELEGDQSLVHLAAAAASLGQIGDRRSIEPLLLLLNRNDLAPLTRAFAAVALGGVCDKDPLPWNAAFSTCTNYRASTETLTDGAAGILDIL